MFIDDVLQQSNAVLDAFLPGTSGGQGIVDAITGSYVIRPNGQSDKKNSLSFDWPRNAVKNIKYFRLPYKNSQYIKPMAKYQLLQILSSKWDMDLAHL